MGKEHSRQGEQLEQRPWGHSELSVFEGLLQHGEKEGAAVGGEVREGARCCIDCCKCPSKQKALVFTCTTLD